MEYFKTENFTINIPTVVTFGKFDGIHTGHKKLIDKAVRIASEEKLSVIMCSFDMSGWSGYNREYISSADERKKICRELGVDILIEYPFNNEIASMEPARFIKEFINEKLHAKYVIAGNDWHFGRNREGSNTLLTELQEKYGYRAVIEEKCMLDGYEISSTRIRNEIKKGCMEKVCELLGYPFMFYGKIQHGNRIGRKLGFPTVNIIPEEGKILPPFGAYASKITYGNEIFYGVTNVGKKPTVAGKGGITVETHILNFDRNVYDESMQVSLLHYIRPEQKFSSLDELKKQLQNDIEKSLTYQDICDTISEAD